MPYRGRLVAAIALGLVVLLPRAAVTNSASDAPVTFVPWKVLKAVNEPVKGDLVLFWIPASQEEIRHSPLLTSRTLSTYAGQCVGMEVVRPDDDETIERLGATGAVPAAVLVDSGGAVVARAGGESGLSCPSVEKMVRDSVASSEAELDRMLDSARELVQAGDRKAAVALYRRVGARRCMSPRKAREADRALKKLGAD